jgi:hypothetical protein
MGRSPQPKNRKLLALGGVLGLAGIVGPVGLWSRLHPLIKEHDHQDQQSTADDSVETTQTSRKLAPGGKMG